MNKFEILCELASKERWCWKIGCTTCGCLHFRYSFKEIANGKTPNQGNWLITVRKKSYRKQLGGIPFNFTDNEKIEILTICQDADIKRIHKICTFPDWLGYLGLVLYLMRTNRHEYRELALNWSSQLIELVPKFSKAYLRLKHLIQSKEIIEIKDLELCEHNIY